MHKHANKIPITHKKMSLPNFGYISNSQSIKKLSNNVQNHIQHKT